MLGICISTILLGISYLTITSFRFAYSKSDHCYLPPSCNDNSINYNTTTGFTNHTGWAGISSSHCCQICSDDMPQVVCFEGDDDAVTECQNKTGVADYDYLILDQLWLPSFCKALNLGYDPTLSHLQGSKCIEKKLILKSTDSRLSIHGLWPNYYGGYPQCCEQPQPLTPALMQQWSNYYEIGRLWFDPTTASVDSHGIHCSTCYLHNHEFEKHGNCFSPGNAYEYFNTGIQLATETDLQGVASYLDKSVGTNISAAMITSQYPKKVNLICDAKYLNSSYQVLLEIQTCWKKIILDPSSSMKIAMIDCPEARASGFTIPCNESKLIYIFDYNL